VSKIKSKIVLILDLDETLITRDPPRALLEKCVPNLLRLCDDKGIILAIASRNKPYVVNDVLSQFDFDHFFYKVVADFRPKNYQVKEIIYHLRKNKVIPEILIFVDDYRKNCILVASLNSSFNFPIYSILYTIDGLNLEFVLTNIINEKWKELENSAVSYE
jgi:HAD superfamily phosphatase (TIGR01681 family)